MLQIIDAMHEMLTTNYVQHRWSIVYYASRRDDDVSLDADEYLKYYPYDHMTSHNRAHVIIVQSGRETVVILGSRKSINIDDHKCQRYANSMIATMPNAVCMSIIVMMIIAFLFCR